MQDPDGARLARRLRRRTVLLALGASLLGAVMAVAYLSVLSPTEGCGDCQQGPQVEILGGVISFLVLGGIGVRVGDRIYRSLRWLQEGRAPTDRERRSTLRFPGRVALTLLVAWAAAAAGTSGVLALQGADGRALMRTASTVLLVGLLVSTFNAFALERIGRPVFARALEGDVVLPSRWLGLQPRLLLGWLVSSAVPLTTLLLLPFTTADEDRSDVGVTIFSLSLLGLVGGLGITAVAGRGITAPLRDLRRALTRVGDGDVDVTVPVSASGEVGHLQQGFNVMVAGVRERERLHTLLGHHVGADVAELALQGDLGSEQRQASVLFIDVVGSTAMAERLQPAEVVGRLNDLFDVVVRVVESEGGLVNKFDGDGALCIFGAPTTIIDHATRALRAARTLLGEVQGLQSRHPDLDVGIGVASGTVVAGRVGAAERYEYTVLGRPVNTAARLTDLAKGRAARVLATEATVTAAATHEAERWVDGGAVVVRGVADPVWIREPAPT